MKEQETINQCIYDFLNLIQPWQHLIRDSRKIKIDIKEESKVINLKQQQFSTIIDHIKQTIKTILTSVDNDSLKKVIIEKMHSKKCSSSRKYEQIKSDYNRIKKLEQEQFDEKEEEESETETLDLPVGNMLTKICETKYEHPNDKLMLICKLSKELNKTHALNILDMIKPKKKKK